MWSSPQVIVAHGRLIVIVFAFDRLFKPVG